MQECLKIDPIPILNNFQKDLNVHFHSFCTKMKGEWLGNFSFLSQNMQNEIKEEMPTKNSTQQGYLIKKIRKEVK